MTIIISGNGHNHIWKGIIEFLKSAFDFIGQNVFSQKPAKKSCSRTSAAVCNFDDMAIEAAVAALRVVPYAPSRSSFVHEIVSGRGGLDKAMIGGTAENSARNHEGGITFNPNHIVADFFFVMP